MSNCNDSQVIIKKKLKNRVEGVPTLGLVGLSICQAACPPPLPPGRSRQMERGGWTDGDALPSAVNSLTRDWLVSLILPTRARDTITLLPGLKSLFPASMSNSDFLFSVWQPAGALSVHVIVASRLALTFDPVSPSPLSFSLGPSRCFSLWLCVCSFQEVAPPLPGSVEWLWVKERLIRKLELELPSSSRSLPARVAAGTGTQKHDDLCHRNVTLS